MSVSRAVGLASASLLVISGTLVHAAEASRGGVSVGYQFIHIDGFESSVGTLDIGTADSQSLNFELEYALTERWTLSAGLPLIAKRYRGPAPHVPAALDPPSDDTFVDDGDYHTTFQDFHLGIRYLLHDEPFLIEPFFFAGIPSNDYPYFGQAAVGQNLLRAEIGSTFTYFPPLSDLYYRLQAGYSFVEETRGTNINHWRVNAEVGYFFNPRVSGRVFVLGKQGQGAVFPDDFPAPRTNERWHQHDRMVKHNYVNAGLGLVFNLDGRYRLSVSAMTMLHADQVHVMKYTGTVAIARLF